MHSCHDSPLTVTRYVPLEVGSSASRPVVPTLISIPPPLELLPAKVMQQLCRCAHLFSHMHA
jgi:hypothetical protein